MYLFVRRPGMFMFVMTLAKKLVRILQMTSWCAPSPDAVLIDYYRQMKWILTLIRSSSELVLQMKPSLSWDLAVSLKLTYLGITARMRKS